MCQMVLVQIEWYGGVMAIVNLGKGLPEWLNVTKEIMSNLSEDESAKIANLNAKNL